MAACAGRHFIYVLLLEEKTEDDFNFTVQERDATMLIF